MIECKRCGNTDHQKNGKRTLGDGVYQAYRCKKCGHSFNGERLTSFKEAKLRIDEK